MSENSQTQFCVVDRAHAERASLESFIASVFSHSYGATVSHFADTLLGWKGKDGQWLAALGYTGAAAGPLFVEQYGNGPTQEWISKKLGADVRRQWLVEVGNLAAVHAGSARQLIARAIVHLHQQGFSWVVFTATRALLNSFERLEVKTVELGPADPSALPDGGENWGTYYDTKPNIMTGSITLGYVALRAREQMQAKAETSAVAMHERVSAAGEFPAGAGRGSYAVLA